MLKRRRVATIAALVGVVLPSSTISASGDTSTGGISAVDRASGAGISQVSMSYGTYVRDADRDGDKDFLYNRHSGSPMRLYLNNGSGRFSLRATAFPGNHRPDCVWAPPEKGA